MNKPQLIAKRNLVSVAAAAVLVVGTVAANTAFAASGILAQTLEQAFPDATPILDPIDQWNGQTHVVEDAGATLVQYFMW